VLKYIAAYVSRLFPCTILALTQPLLIYVIFKLLSSTILELGNISKGRYRNLRYVCLLNFETQNIAYSPLGFTAFIVIVCGSKAKQSNKYN
jgi:hypothetical protein